MAPSTPDQVVLLYLCLLPPPFQAFSVRTQHVSPAPVHARNFDHQLTGYQKSDLVLLEVRGACWGAWHRQGRTRSISCRALGNHTPPHPPPCC
jgi:hypothetical protein